MSFFVEDKPDLGIRHKRKVCMMHGIICTITLLHTLQQTTNPLISFKAVFAACTHFLSLLVYLLELENDNIRLNGYHKARTLMRAYIYCTRTSSGSSSSSNSSNVVRLIGPDGDSMPTCNLYFRFPLFFSMGEGKSLYTRLLYCASRSRTAFKFWNAGRKLNSELLIFGYQILH